jgi:GrpB-like predicted nucleotidyltransferase (UPF0157 family)
MYKEGCVSDQLDHMSNEELWQLFPIVLKPYNPKYHQWYLEEKRILIKAIGYENIKRINHFGSTAVHNLLAKPTIDILIEVNEESIIDQIPSIYDQNDDYRCLKQKDRFNHPSLLMLKGYTEKGYKDRVFHIHVRIYNNHRELYFRDYLRDHPEVAQKYGELKIELMKKHKHNRDLYTDKKSDFIDQYTEIAKKIYPHRYDPKQVE